MDIPPDQCMWMWFTSRILAHHSPVWELPGPLTILYRSVCLHCKQCSDDHSCSYAMWWVSQSRNSFCWVPRSVQFLFTQITFTKGWNSYFHWSHVRGPPPYQHQILTSYYCSTKLMSFIHIVFPHFRREEVDPSRYKVHVVDARDDSNTLTIGRAEGWVWRGGQTKGLQKKVKDAVTLLAVI